MPWHVNTFLITSSFWGESIGHWRIPFTNRQYCRALMFSLLSAWTAVVERINFLVIWNATVQIRFRPQCVKRILTWRLPYIYCFCCLSPGALQFQYESLWWFREPHCWSQPPWTGPVSHHLHPDRRTELIAWPWHDLGKESPQQEGQLVCLVVTATAFRGRAFRFKCSAP